MAAACPLLPLCWLCLWRSCFHMMQEAGNCCSCSRQGQNKARAKLEVAELSGLENSTGPRLPNVGSETAPRCGQRAVWSPRFSGSDSHSPWKNTTTCGSSPRVITNTETELLNRDRISHYFNAWVSQKALQLVDVKANSLFKKWGRIPTRKHLLGSLAYLAFCQAGCSDDFELTPEGNMVCSSATATVCSAWPWPIA